MKPHPFPVTLPEIQKAVDESFATMASFVKPLSDEQFHYRPEDGKKWSVGEGMNHLILASMGIASALGRPKSFFERFGSIDRPSMTYKEMYQTYFDRIVGAQAPKNVSPDRTSPKTRQELMNSWQMIQQKFFDRLPINWTEEELDQHCVFHPAFGQITMREMLFFVIYHNYHHLNIMQRSLP